MESVEQEGLETNTMVVNTKEQFTDTFKHFKTLMLFFVVFQCIIGFKG